MKVLGINASGRENGNCRILLDEALKGAKSKGAQTELIFLNSLKISPWREKLPKDDMPKLEQKILKADVIILASPIYFGSLSAQGKAMIDRCQALWERKNLRKEALRKNKAKAALICVEASNREDFFKNAEQIARNFFAVIEAQCCATLFCAGLDEPKAVLKRPEFLNKAYDLGKNLLP
ncbi:MAG: flavodoxin family protein [Candidatus Omnitrophica bacterium]|nr:flavodoxin family protein [Candidatus Omnitrophota bacterium]